MDFFLCDTDLMVSMLEVYLRKNLCTMLPIKKVIYPRKWVSILDGYGVEGSVVHAKAE